MDQSTHISHQGIVLRCEGSKAYVYLEANAACSSCRAKGACGVNTTSDELYEVPRNSLAVGDQVMIEITSSTALLSVSLAYLFPFLLIVAIIIVGSLFSMDEGMVAMTALGAIGIYYLGLARYFKRRQMQFNLNVRRL